MWKVELKFFERWIEIAYGPTRDDCEWAVAKWKMENNMTGDPFRYSKM